MLAWDDWGVIVNGTYKIGSNTRYAKAAGGFAGSLCGAVLGEKDTPGSGIHADKIRSVIAGEYAGGCFGIADVSGAANISANGDSSGNCILVDVCSRRDACICNYDNTYTAFLSGCVEALFWIYL